MSDVLESKAAVINEVLPVRDLLCELHGKLAEQPRSTTATRQLGTIIKKLEGWHEAFTLEPPVQQKSANKEELLREIMELVERKLAA